MDVFLVLHLTDEKTIEPIDPQIGQSFFSSVRSVFPKTSISTGGHRSRRRSFADGRVKMDVFFISHLTDENRSNRWTHKSVKSLFLHPSDRYPKNIHLN
jgi:hypothetical protein